jgi:hypothetical protein
MQYNQTNIRRYTSLQYDNRGLVFFSASATPKPRGLPPQPTLPWLLRLPGELRLFSDELYLPLLCYATTFDDR